MNEIRWRRSSYSGGDGNSDCVELAQDLGAVRDSKNPQGPVLAGDVRALLAWAKQATDR
jgi:hypothetical protein